MGCKLGFTVFFSCVWCAAHAKLIAHEVACGFTLGTWIYTERHAAYFFRAPIIMVIQGFLTFLFGMSRRRDFRAEGKQRNFCIDAAVNFWHGFETAALRTRFDTRRSC